MRPAAVATNFIWPALTSGIADDVTTATACVDDAVICNRVRRQSYCRQRPKPGNTGLPVPPNWGGKIAELYIESCMVVGRPASCLRNPYRPTPMPPCFPGVEKEGGGTVPNPQLGGRLDTAREWARFISSRLWLQRQSSASGISRRCHTSVLIVAR